MRQKKGYYKVKGDMAISSTGRRETELQNRERIYSSWSTAGLSEKWVVMWWWKGRIITCHKCLSLLMLWFFFLSWVMSFDCHLWKVFCSFLLRIKTERVEMEWLYCKNNNNNNKNSSNTWVVLSFFLCLFKFFLIHGCLVLSVKFLWGHCEVGEVYYILGGADVGFTDFKMLS